MGVMRIFTETFIFNTSMRGFMKLYKTPHRFLKIIWAVYVISMLSLWTTACYFLIEHYSGFYVTVQQSERIQDITPLPSMTLCSLTPMGDHAPELWNNGSIMSPKQLHQAMQISMLKAFGTGTRRTTAQLYAAKDIFYADKMSTYFQNINIEDARRIGMHPDELVVFCLMKHTRNNNPSVSHEETCRLSVRWVRHPLYMNCYTVTVDPRDTMDVSSISLILRSGLPQHRPMQAHIFDLFSQSLGFKLTLHEPGSYPGIDENGISIGMERNTEIRYNMVQHRRINLDNKKSTCLSATKVEQRDPLTDFGEVYNYTFSACMSQAIGRLILQECNCVSAFHMVGFQPTKEKPFCHYHDVKNINALMTRLDCVRNINLPDKIGELRLNTCLSRCDYSRYDMQVSSAQWLPTHWQLRIILRLTRAWDTVTEGTEDTKTLDEAMKDLTEFMHTGLESEMERRNESHLNLDRLTLVTVSRASYNTIVKTETLQVTLSTLLAQIGGLGSVTIGLTITVLFEIYEYIYLIIFNLHKRSKEKRKPAAGTNEGGESGVKGSGIGPASTASVVEGGEERKRTIAVEHEDEVPLKPLRAHDANLDSDGRSSGKSDHEAASNSSNYANFRTEDLEEDAPMA